MLETVTPRTSSVVADWSPLAAKRFAIGIDWGFKTDHSALVVAGVFPTATGDIIGIQLLKKFLLQTPYSEVISLAGEQYDRIRANNRPVAVVVDSRAQLPLVDLLMSSGLPPLAVLGASLTNGERHGNRHEIVRLGEGTVLREYRLSRAQLFRDFATSFEQGEIRVCEEGCDSLYTELAGLQWERSAGAARVTCPQGSHDDLAVASALCVWALRHLPTRVSEGRPTPTGSSSPDTPPIGSWT